MASIRDRLAGQDPTRQNLKRRLSQVGNYNQTHRHGKPIGDFNASHVAGQPMPQLGPGAQTRGGQVPATHDPRLDVPGAAVNRNQAQPGQIPPWVLAQMHAQQGGLTRVPPGVVPTKPVEAVQGSDSLTGLQPATGPASVAYPVRRPVVPQPPRRRRNQVSVSRG